MAPNHRREVLTESIPSYTTSSSLRRRSHEYSGKIQVDDEHGLWIRLNNTTGTVHLEVEPDSLYPHIHPNCYAPRSLHNMQLLKGGGSGTVVFGAVHPIYGPIVMKHGGAKDTKDILALAHICQQVRQRGSNEVAAYMLHRIPEFVGVYLSKHHVRDRATEFWNTVRSTGLDVLIQKQDPIDDNDDNNNNNTTDVLDPIMKALRQHEHNQSSREFHVVQGEDLEFEVQPKQVILYIPEYDADRTIQHGFDFLANFGKVLSQAQTENFWKITLAQKSIGGPHSKNGAQCLYDGDLKGEMLDTVVQEFVTIIRNLRSLTYDNENNGYERISQEMEGLKQSRDVTQVSTAVDSFCGSAICKNFTPGTGRFDYLRTMGQKFRESSILLCENECSPASYLGHVLDRDSKMADVFTTAPSERCALNLVEDSWLELLELATSFFHKSATNLIWTCGLTDAGLHNLFISKECGIELFDLGEPQLVPQPAFLTKFLMSFFHTLGMEEEADSAGWVRRFDIVDGKLALTPDTEAAIPYVCKAFNHTVDCFISELFEGDTKVKTLLLRYVVLQILSDASFCLQRWEQKGGGKERFRKRAECLSKWLWRTLWDLYIASFVLEQIASNEASE
jgi:hypothetical protein